MACRGVPSPATDIARRSDRSARSAHVGNRGAHQTVHRTDTPPQAVPGACRILSARFHDAHDQRAHRRTSGCDHRSQCRYRVWSTRCDPPSTHRSAGTGWQLVPPQRLSGKTFDAFRVGCASFVGFQNIDALPYLATLEELARRFRRTTFDAEVLRFCDDLVGLVRHFEDQRLPVRLDAMRIR